MEKISHTPGPWRIEGSTYGHGITIYGGESDSFLAEAVAGAGLSLDEVDANARLISAAPGLLTALRGLIIDANRLCDRNLGGTYEADCRRSIELAESVVRAAVTTGEDRPR